MSTGKPGNPHMIWDEWILILHYYLENRSENGRYLHKKKTDQIQELSNELIQLGEVLEIEMDPSYRNQVGIAGQYRAMQLADPTTNNRDEKVVKKAQQIWNIFALDQHKLSSAVKTIRAGIKNDSSIDYGVHSPNTLVKQHEEGFYLTKTHFMHEQNVDFLDKKIILECEEHNIAKCLCCDFAIEKEQIAIAKYPRHNFEYHLKWESEDILEGVKPDPVNSDLLCVSCHKQVHSKFKWQYQ